jgi:hypothetical protein
MAINSRRWFRQVVQTNRLYLPSLLLAGQCSPRRLLPNKGSFEPKAHAPIKDMTDDYAFRGFAIVELRGTLLEWEDAAGEHRLWNWPGSFPSHQPYARKIEDTSLLVIIEITRHIRMYTEELFVQPNQNVCSEERHKHLYGRSQSYPPRRKIYKYIHT